MKKQFFENKDVIVGRAQNEKDWAFGGGMNDVRVTARTNAPRLDGGII